VLKTSGLAGCHREVSTSAFARGAVISRHNLCAGARLGATVHGTVLLDVSGFEVFDATPSALRDAKTRTGPRPPPPRR